MDQNIFMIHADRFRDFRGMFRPKCDPSRWYRIVTDPLAAGVALMGGTAAGVNMAEATIGGEKQSPDASGKW